MKPVLSAIAALALAVPMTAGATILTFDERAPDQATTAGVALPEGYGDNVTSAAQDGFTYDVGSEGFTPNITLGGPGATLWTTDFGGLVNVIYRAPSSEDFIIELSASGGFDVFLYDFDVAGWPQIDYTVALTIFDGNDNTLFQQDAFFVAGANGAFSTVAFDTPLVAQTIKIVLGTAVLGGSNDNIGVDNLRFGQGLVDDRQVPVPAAALLFGSALALIRRRRNA